MQRSIKGERLKDKHTPKECLLQKGDDLLIERLPGPVARVGLPVRVEEMDGVVRGGWTVVRILRS